MNSEQQSNSYPTYVVFIYSAFLLASDDPWLLPCFLNFVFRECFAVLV